MYLSDDDRYYLELAAWRKGLSDSQVVELARDYRKGDRDEATVDGWKEFNLRVARKELTDPWSRRHLANPEGYIRPSQIKGSKTYTQFCDRHKDPQPGTRPGRCRECRELNGLPPINYPFPRIDQRASA